MSQEDLGLGWVEIWPRNIVSYSFRITKMLLISSYNNVFIHCNMYSYSKFPSKMCNFCSFLRTILKINFLIFFWGRPKHFFNVHTINLYLCGCHFSRGLWYCVYTYAVLFTRVSLVMFCVFCLTGISQAGFVVWFLC